MVHDPTQPDLKLSLGQLLDQVCQAALNAVSSTDSSAPGEQRRIPVDMSINLSSPIQVQVFGKMLPVSTIRVVGTAVITDSSNRRIFKAVVRDIDDAPMAGCMLNEWPDGSLMMLMASSADGALTMRGISVEDREKKKIYKQKLGTIRPAPIKSDTGNLL